MTGVCACRLWKKLPKHEDFIPSIPIEQAVSDGDVDFARWQVHKDWVLMVSPLSLQELCFFLLANGGGLVHRWVDGSLGLHGELCLYSDCICH